LREVIAFAAERLMALEVQALTGAAYSERSPHRLAQRNGYRERDWAIRAATVELRIPMLQEGQLLPGFPGAAPGGGEGADGGNSGSLRGGHLEPLGRRAGQSAGDGRDFQGQVSRLCAEIDERVRTFLGRPSEGDCPICGPCRRRQGPVAPGGRPGPELPKLAALFDEAEEDVLAYMSFPTEHRAKIHSTNLIVRLNAEVERRTEVVGILPNEAAITRLVGAILLEQNDEWSVQRAAT
jgi:transposase-like protein